MNIPQHNRIPPRMDARGSRRLGATYHYVVLAVTIALLFSLVAFFSVRNWEQQIHNKEFERRTQGHTSAIQSTLDRNTDLLAIIAGLFTASDYVNRNEFRVFTRAILESRPEIQALEWVPSVSAAERENLEQQAQQSGIPGFRFTERNAEGQLQRAGSHDRYFPVFYIEPLTGNEAAAGFDMASNPIRRSALEQARDSGRPVVSPWITLVQKSHEQFGFLAIYPYYQKDRPTQTVEQRQAYLSGYIVGVFRLEDFILKALSTTAPAGLDLRITETNRQDAESAVYQYWSRTRPHPPKQPEPATLTLRTQVSFSNGTWALTYAASPALRDKQTDHVAWAVLVGGLLLSALLGIYLTHLTRGSQRINRLATKLAATNNELQSEISERRQSENLLARFGRILDGSANEILVADAETLKIVQMNKGAKDNLGYTGSELPDISLLDINASMTLTSFRKLAAPLKQGSEEIVSFESVHRRKDGSEYPVEIHLQLSIQETPSVYVSISQDISERRRNIEQMHKLSSVVEQTSDLVMITSPEGLIEYVNPGFEVITGYAQCEVVGQSVSLLKSGRHDRAFYKGMWDTILAGNTFRGILQNLKKNGELFYEEKTITPLKDAEGNTINMVSTGKDVTRQMQSSARIEHLAFHDSLTDLPNRQLFRDRLQQAISRQQRKRGMLALLFLDLDRFKTINDSMGHDVGDMILMEMAKRLVTLVRHTDTVARLGGDEFTVILEDIDDAQQAGNHAKKVIAAMAEPIPADGRSFVLTTSLGIALFPTDGADVDTLLKQADIAMYHAKEHGRNRFEFYCEEMSARVMDSMTSELELRNALEQGEFFLEYQPIIALDTGKIFAVEALLRWLHPERGIIPPDAFISTLEETHLISPATQWVATRVCKDWPEIARHLPEGYVAINFSPHCFREASLTKHVKNILAQHAMTAKHLVMEITESALMQQSPALTDSLNDLRATGVRIALDDFGTGQSSLSHLRAFPIDLVKIDRSFVRDVPHDANDCELVTAIISLAHNLKKQVVAEGVETVSQQDFLRLHHCDAVQGFLYSKALPLSALLDLLATQPYPPRQATRH